jgi:RNA polymerase sigma-70 factor (ECF subfamily)
MEALTRMAQRNERGLIASAAAGDEAAMQRIVTEYHDDMLRVCSYVTRDDVLAEEATYAAWAKAWRKLGSVREPASLRPWLVSIAVNEAKRILGKRKRQAEFESGSDPAEQPGGLDPATGVASIDLRRAMSRLDPDERALLAMRYGAGFSAKELAAATGKSPAATRQRLKRLLDRLREDLGHG